ncbi:MAG: amino acid ABC transporter substrate-binding protein [Chloroflexi bacterium]|nr:amino acid ABC transporter substrate-binding protein [Chloroflexota bacterium]MCY3582578.1 amino acid ABC transporter substrate-binding protein [Chloroflexota bacterium]MCY3717562.1 amino acid ABC transporter substrate-binding protein [Chloroflexota bacterium]MDE2650268.1 amino acid ABC transporter substrate-binding protein [Chloroflexota bacterium]MXX51834.1 amino acid ABC transporter substrate-binding protein [Chloroflexota bacterium]
MKRYIVFALVVISLLALGSGLAMAQDDGHIVERIMERGELLCGVNTVLPGFGTQNDAGDFVGFDVDFCRAVAAAVLGDADAVGFRPLTAAERPTAMAGGEIDLLVRNTTWTLSRDTEWGATFGPTTFYDGQGIMVKVDLGITNLAELGEESITMCATAGTTTELNITDTENALGADWELSTFQDFDAIMDAYEAGACDAFTSDVSSLVSRKATSTDPAAHLILPEVISKEPLGPVSPQSDATFADIVRWTVWGMMTAEELGINSMNVGDYMDSEDAGIGRLLGLGDNVAGEYFGINDGFMVDVISQIGNYGEVFERHLGKDTIFGLDRGVNALWTDGGLLYASPFR